MLLRLFCDGSRNQASCRNGKSRIELPSTSETLLCRLRERDYSRSLASEPDVKVSLHPAQASQRPCEGPISSKTTCWLHDTRQTSIPFRGRSYWIPGSWNLRMVYTDDIPFLNPSQESTGAGQYQDAHR